MKADSQASSSHILIEKDEALRIVNEVRGLFRSEDEGFEIRVFSWSTVSQRWARNRPMIASTQRDLSVGITRYIRGYKYDVVTNQYDSESLKSATRYAEHQAGKKAPGEFIREMEVDRPQWDNPPGIPVWSDSTFKRTPTDNGKVIRNLTQTSLDAGMISAGYLETGAANVFHISRDPYGREDQGSGEVTQGQCSITVRHPMGTGSGWAGNTSFDINRLDLLKIAETAFDKCIKSIDPVRIEPGRFQVILEPQASATFFQIMLTYMQRTLPENHANHPMHLGADNSLRRFRSKIGLPVIDRRLTIEHHPDHPVVGTHPHPGVGPVTIVKDGVLTEMFHNYSYALNELVDQNPAVRRTSFRVPGTSTTTEAMISNMERGLILTMVSHPELIDMSSALFTGFTRNGLWLVENGRITRAVQNFRWTESPLFILNNVEEIGTSVPVFYPANMRNSLVNSLVNSLNNVAVPALRVNDFSFTSIIDAI